MHGEDSLGWFAAVDRTGTPPYARGRLLAVAFR